MLYAALFWLELSIAQRVGGGYILHYWRENIFVIMIRVPNVRLHRLLSRSNRFVQYLEVFKRALPWILESVRNSNNRFAVTNHGRGHGKFFDQLLTYIKQWLVKIILKNMITYWPGYWFDWNSASSVIVWLCHCTWVSDNWRYVPLKITETGNWSEFY